MPRDPLTSLAALTTVHDELLRRIDALHPPPAIDPRCGAAGEAFARALLFERWPDLVGGTVLTTAQRFYNRYFWFVRFVALWEARHGHDAGLEQQAFQLLEHSGIDLDWDQLEEIEARARACPTA